MPFVLAKRQYRILPVEFTSYLSRAKSSPDSSGTLSCLGRCIQYLEHISSSTYTQYGPLLHKHKPKSPHYAHASCYTIQLGAPPSRHPKIRNSCQASGKAPYFRCHCGENHIVGFNQLFYLSSFPKLPWSPSCRRQGAKTLLDIHSRSSVLALWMALRNRPAGSGLSVSNVRYTSGT